MALQAGTLLNRYRLVEKVGSGGMSEVWRAEDTTLHRTVAVKIIQEPVAEDAESRERFLREARLVAAMEHPNILPVFDFGTAVLEGRDVSYLVTPLVHGGSLKDQIARQVAPRTVLSWLAAVAAALDHAHAKGILHRDVKPANVLLDSNGRPLLADFGLARSADSVSALTAKGVLLGTPHYMAPEQASGDELDARVDQYALAVTAFQLLTGRPPFKADSPLGVLHQHAVAPPPKISEHLRGAGRMADAVIARAMAKDPRDRYASCTELVTALSDALEAPDAASATAETRRTTARRDLGEAPASDPDAVTASDAPTALLTPAPALGPPGPAVTANRPAEQLKSPDSMRSAPASRATLIALAAILAVSALGGGAILLFGGRFARPGAGEDASPAVPSPAASVESPPTSDAPPEPLPTPALEAPGAETAPPPPPPAAEAPGTNSSSPATNPQTPPGSTAARGEKSAPSRADWREPGGEHASPAPNGSRGGSRQSAERPPAAHGPALEPLLVAGSSADSALSAVYHALDPTRKPDGRLAKSDFASALGDARRAFATRPNGEARFLEAYSRGGVEFANGESATAWALLLRALDESRGPESRTMSFVRSAADALGTNPGRDGSWVMGLAFADVRGDLDEELAAAAERAPDSGQVVYARALRAAGTGRASEARRLKQRACELGERAACEP